MARKKPINLCEEADATIRTNLLAQGLGGERHPVAYKATTIVFVQSEFFFQLQVTRNLKMNSDCAETVGFQAALLLRISQEDVNLGLLSQVQLGIQGEPHGLGAY